MPPGGEDRLADAVARWQACLTDENGATEPHLKLALETLDADARPDKVLAPESARQAIHLLNALPHGVQGMSHQVPGLVETSCNLAIVKIAAGALDIISSQRSSSMTRLEEITARVRSVAALAGAEAARLNHHPAWPPDPDAALLGRCQAVYRREFGEEPQVEAIHAGLECGLIGAKVPGMEMISIGPTLRNPHSPDEKLFVPSIGKMLRFLTALLASYGESP
jgi:dipeptidase D